MFHGRFDWVWTESFNSGPEEKLKYLDSAGDLRDLMIPPANQLELLKHDRKGQYSIRINRQWRICFKWGAGDAFDAEIARRRRGVTAEMALRLARYFGTTAQREIRFGKMPATTRAFS